MKYFGFISTIILSTFISNISAKAGCPDNK